MAYPAMPLAYILLAALSALIIVNVVIVLALLRRLRRAESLTDGVHLLLAEHPWLAKGVSRNVDVDS